MCFNIAEGLQCGLTAASAQFSQIWAFPLPPCPPPSVSLWR